jgi:hypothetical protein
MGGATILCGDYEGGDKAGSPIASVLDQAYVAAFGVKRRGKLGRNFARLLGRTTAPEQDAVEQSILEVMYNEEGEIPSSVAQLLLPHLRAYQSSLLQRCAIENTPDAIQKIMTPSTSAKYGRKFDAGWHLYCLHDLVAACEKSAVSGTPIQVIWS